MKRAMTSVAHCTATVALLLGGWATAGATVTYHYEGGDLSNPISLSGPQVAGLGRISGDVEVADALGPLYYGPFVQVLHFSFTDGLNTATDADYQLVFVGGPSPEPRPPNQFFGQTDDTGQIVRWQFSVVSFHWEDLSFFGLARLSSAGGGTVGGDQVHYFLPGQPPYEPTIVDSNTAADNTGIGRWTLVPVPTAAFLYASALAALGWVRRKGATP